MMGKYILLCVLFLSISSYAQYTGVRISFKNEFLSGAVKTLIPSAVDIVNNQLFEAMAFNTTLGFWPFKSDFEITNFKNTQNLTIDPEKGQFALIKRNNAFFLEIPNIEDWIIEFDYKYKNSFGTTVGKGKIQVKNLQLKAEFSLIGSGRGPHLKLFHVKLKFGDTKITFSEGGMVKFVGFLFNSFQWLMEFFLNYYATPIINLIAQFIPLINPTIPLGESGLGIDIGFSETPIIGDETSDYFLKTEFFIPDKHKYPTVKRPPALNKPSPGTNDMEITINEYPFTTLLASAHNAGLSQILLTNAKIGEWTQGFVHLRTSDFYYFIPELEEKYGDVEMALNCQTYGNYPEVILSAHDNSTNLNGTATCEFLLNGGGHHMKSLFTIQFNLFTKILWAFDPEKEIFYLTFEQMELSESKQTEIKEVRIEEIIEVEKELNNLLNFLRNGVNIFLFEAGFQVPDIPQVKFSNLSMEFHDLGYIRIGSDISISI